MSADNGMVIKKFSDTDFKVYEYDASSGRESLRGSYFKTLEEALKFASDLQTEYGVTYQVVPKQRETKKSGMTMGELRDLTRCHEFFISIPDSAKVTFEWDEWKGK